jgi:hypothetical protein
MPTDSFTVDLLAVRSDETRGRPSTSGYDVEGMDRAALYLNAFSQFAQNLHEDHDLQEKLSHYWSSTELSGTWATLLDWLEDPSHGSLSGSHSWQTESSSRDMRTWLDSLVWTSLSTQLLRRVWLVELRQPSGPKQLSDMEIGSIPSGPMLNDIVGPFYDAEGLTRWLGISTDELLERVVDKLILSCPTQDDGDVYPAWQFDAEGRSLPGLGDTIRALSASTDDPWQIAIWFSSPSSYLGDKSPREWLRQELDAEVVLDLAVKSAARWNS